MDFNKKISVKDIKTGIDNLSNIGSLIGKDNTLFEGINFKMNLDVEECFKDSYKKEALIAEIILQNLTNGAYVDVSDAHNNLEHDHWRDIVREYANKYGIK